MGRYSWAIVGVMLASLCLAFASYLPSDQKHSTPTKLKYTRAHSLGNGYTFDPRDGWQTVNVSNLSYKHGPRSPGIGKTSKITTVTTKHSSHNPLEYGKLKSAIKDLFKGLMGKGEVVKVTTTWYTGHDLLNPSCWKNPVWAPTDHSFACALTQEGWTSKPKCFDFVELCNGPRRCVFARVVDSCAGCAKGSKHVDLTKAAFSELAPLDAGVLEVAMRLATAPSDWQDGLWGPKV